MNPFSPIQEDAMRELIELWGADRTVLVGGAALTALTGMPWRTTLDIDFVVTVEPKISLEELSARPNWQKDPKHVPRWKYRDTVVVDVVPVTPEILEAGELRWPRSGATMNTAGLELAVRLGAPFLLSDGTAVRVAPLPVIVILKMASFLDRPHDRTRDLADIAWVLDAYVPDDDDRRFDPRLEELDVLTTESSAFVLGEELRAIANAYAPLVERFVHAVERDWLDVLVARGPPGWACNRNEAQRQLRALELGFRRADS